MSGSPQKAEQINWPDFAYNTKTGIATLKEVVIFEDTGIYGHVVAIEGATLAADGRLTTLPGLQWNFGDWPALNNLPMIYASLSHDPLSVMIGRGLLPKSCWRPVNRYLSDRLKAAGASRLRQRWVFFGTQYLRPIKNFLAFWK